MEIIITVVVTAVLSAIILQAMGTNAQRSAYPLFAVRSNLSLQDVMENMTADYKALFLTGDTPMTTFQTRILNGTYWSPSDAFSAEISTRMFSVADCGVTSPFDNCYEEQACGVGQDCHLFRVTITQNSTDQSLSALFAE